MKQFELGYIQASTSANPIFLFTATSATLFAIFIIHLRSAISSLAVAGYRRGAAYEDRSDRHRHDLN